MNKPIHTVFEMKDRLNRASGDSRVLIRTPDHGLQLVRLHEEQQYGHGSMIIEPVSTPPELVELATLSPGDRFLFQEHLDAEFEVLEVLCVPDHELIMAVRNVREGWRGRIGLSTGAVDWHLGRYYQTLVFPRRRAEDHGRPAAYDVMLERRYGR